MRSHPRERSSENRRTTTATLVAVAAGLALFAGLLVAVTADAHVPDEVHVNIIRVENAGCSNDAGDFRVTALLENRTVGQTEEATDQDRPLFGAVFPAEPTTYPAEFRIRVEEGEPNLFAPPTYVPCDAQDGNGTTGTLTYDPDDYQELENGHSHNSTWYLEGDGDDAVRVEVTVGIDPPARPEVTAENVTPSAATIRWDADPDGEARRQTLLWGNQGAYIAHQDGAKAGSHALTDLKDNTEYAVRVLRDASAFSVASRDVTFRTENVAPQPPMVGNSWIEDDGTATVEWTSRTTHDIDRYEIHMADHSPFQPSDETLRATVRPITSFEDQRHGGIEVREDDSQVLVRAVDTGGLHADSNVRVIGWDSTEGKYNPPPWDRPGGEPEPVGTDPGPHDPRGRIEGEGWNGYSDNCDRNTGEEVHAFRDPAASGDGALFLPHGVCRVFFELNRPSSPAELDRYAVRVSGTDEPVHAIIHVSVDGREIFQDQFTAAYGDGFVTHEIDARRDVPAGAAEMRVQIDVMEGPSYPNFELDFIQGHPASEDTRDRYPPEDDGDERTPPPPFPEIDRAIAEGTTLEVSWSLRGPDDRIQYLELQASEGPADHDGRWYTRATLEPDQRQLEVQIDPDDDGIRLIAYLDNGDAVPSHVQEIQRPPTAPPPRIHLDDVVYRGREAHITWELRPRGEDPTRVEVHVGPTLNFSASDATLRDVVDGPIGSTAIFVDGSDAVVRLRAIDAEGRVAASQPMWIERHGPPEVHIEEAVHHGGYLTVEWEGQTPDGADLTLHAGPTPATTSTRAEARPTDRVDVAMNGWVRLEAPAEDDDRYVVLKVTWEGGQYVTDPYPLELTPGFEKRLDKLDHDTSGEAGIQGGVSGDTVVKIFGGSAGVGGIVAGIGAALRRFS